MLVLSQHMCTVLKDEVIFILRIFAKCTLPYLADVRKEVLHYMV